MMFETEEKKHLSTSFLDVSKTNLDLKLPLDGDRLTTGHVYIILANFGKM
jgi:hypothetical protein